MSGWEVMTRKVDDAKADSETALATSQFIHRKILVRLLLGWVFLSATVGGVILVALESFEVPPEIWRD